MKSAIETAEGPNQVTHRRRVALAVVAPVLAGITLAACTQGTTPNVPTSSISSAPTESVPAIPSATASAETTRTATAPPSSSNRSTTAPKAGIAGCVPYFDTSKYVNHEYEVCTAYVVNASEVALQGMYKYGNSRASYAADAARHHFETRYWEQPRQTVEQRVDSWPKTSSLTGNKVEESITVLGISASLAADRAVLQTQEHWRVTSVDGNVLYEPPQQAQVTGTTMCRGRLPGHLLHEWVVVSNARLPNYDCIGFDQSHGLAP